jgi:hypothetical protein
VIYWLFSDYFSDYFVQGGLGFRIAAAGAMGLALVILLGPRTIRCRPE